MPSAQPQHPVALRLKPSLAALLVLFLRLLSIVAVAVQLDDQACGGADEIHNVGADWGLPPELPSVHPPPLQALPHAPLGGGQIPAELSGAMGFWRGHATTIEEPLASM